MSTINTYNYESYKAVHNDIVRKVKTGELPIKTAETLENLISKMYLGETRSLTNPKTMEFLINITNCDIRCMICTSKSEFLSELEKLIDECDIIGGKYFGVDITVDSDLNELRGNTIIRKFTDTYNNQHLSQIIPDPLNSEIDEYIRQISKLKPIDSED